MNPFGPQGANSATTLPGTNSTVLYGAADTWVKDSTGNGFNDGTVLDAGFFNNIIGNLRYIINASGITTPARGDFTALWRAIQSYVVTTLAAYAPLLSPHLKGTPTAPTNLNPADGSQQIATDAFVQNALTTALGNFFVTMTSVFAPRSSPTLIGVPTAPTNSTPTDSSTQIATDAFVQAAITAGIAAWVAALPTTLPATSGVPWNDGGSISIS